VVRYKILFTGRLKPGTSKEQTVQQLVKLSGFDQAKVEKVFFSGKAVKIKAFDDRATAERFRAQLLQRGLVAQIKDTEGAPASKTPKTAPKKAADAQPTSKAQRTKKTETAANSASKNNAQPQATSEAPVDPGTVDSPIPPSKKPNKTRRYILIGLASLAAVLIISLGAVFFLISRSFSTDVPELVVKAENALLGSRAAILGHANIAKIFELQALVANDSRVLTDNEFIAKLQAHGIDPKTQISQAVIGLNVDETLGAYTSMVLVADTPRQSIVNYLNDNYQLDTQTTDGVEVLTFSKQDKNTCRITANRGLIVGDGFIVISHPEKVVDLYRQVNTADGDTVVNQAWLDYRNDHLLSLGVLHPEQLERGISGMGGMLLKGMQSQWNMVESAFLGVQGQMLPPAMNVDFLLQSSNQEWLKASHQMLQTAIDSGGQQSDVEFFRLLLSKIALQLDTSSLSTRFSVDEELVNAGQALIDEGLGGMISMSPGNAPDSPPEEMIDPAPNEYQDELSLNDLPAFENRYNRQYNWIEGSFAGALKSVNINRDDLVAIELEVETSKIPNQPTSHLGEAGQLYAIDVKDAAGKSLLQVETCGSNLNHSPAKLQLNRATKTVRLKPGVSLDQVKSIEGKVKVTVATKTTRQLLPIPLKTTEFANGEARLTINSVENGKVNYSVSGAHGAFLELRALNKDKQYLQSNTYFGTTSNANLQFAGEIAYLELISAQASEELEQPFTITQTIPLHRDDGAGPPATEPKAYDMRKWGEVMQAASTFKSDEAKRKWFGDPWAEAKVGPAELMIINPEVYRGFDGPAFSAQLLLNMPYVAFLENKGNAVQVKFKELLFSDGSTVIRETEHPIPLSFTGFGNGYKDTSKSEQALREQIYLTSGNSRISVPLDDFEVAGQELVNIQGRLEFHLPTALSVRQFESLTLGAQLPYEDFLLRIVGIGQNSLDLEVRGRPDKISTIQLLNDKRQVLTEGLSLQDEQPRFGVKPNSQGEEESARPRKLVKFLYSGAPKTVRIISADKVEVLAFPFSL